MKLNNINISYHCKAIVIPIILIVYLFISSQFLLPNLHKKKYKKSKTKLKYRLELIFIKSINMITIQVSLLKCSLCDYAFCAWENFPQSTYMMRNLLPPDQLSLAIRWRINLLTDRKKLSPLDNSTLLFQPKKVIN